MTPDSPPATPSVSRGLRGESEARSRGWSSVVMAAGVGAANAALAAPLGPQGRLELAALELAFIAGAYPGMAIIAGSPRAIAVELVAAGAFVSSAVAGLAGRSRAPIAAGLLAHGAWDAIHHRNGIGAPAPRGYPRFCLIADLLLVIPLARR